MSAADLGKFAQGFASWRQILGTVPVADRPRIFANAANEIAGFVANGLDRVLAADELTEMATACGLDDMDAVQTTIAEAFDKNRHRKKQWSRRQGEEAENCSHAKK